MRVILAALVAVTIVGLGLVEEAAMALTPLRHVCEENAQGYVECDYNWN
jgi:hypothetical protein